MRQHLLSTKQVISQDQLVELFKQSNRMRDRIKSKLFDPSLARGRVLGILKDEGSTRTRVSFETAMKRLGGESVLLELNEDSSIAKGETVEDTVLTMSQYCDVIAMRHSQKGMVQRCAELTYTPMINMGDGVGEHPTQALLDAYTIQREIGRLDDFNILFVGDLKCSRTVHSLIHLLKLYRGVCVCLCSPYEMRLPDEYRTCDIVYEGVDLRDILQKHGKEMHIIYMTRLQKERYDTRCDLEQTGVFREDIVQKPYYNLGIYERSYLGENTKIMHPLPRNGEIPTDLDRSPQAAYWRQVENGMYVRMALLDNIFNRGDFLPG